MIVNILLIKMNSLSFRIVFQEVPDEISICFCITGCPFSCKGCHSPELQNSNNGEFLSIDEYKDILNKYKNLATCVCFMGGEWEKDFYKYLIIAKQNNYNTCLYTGNYYVSKLIMNNLDYLKVGPYQIKRGGLSNPNSNQKFYDLNNNKIINNRFWR